MKGRDVICLYYHRVSPVKEELSLSPELFQSQLEMLSSRGYSTISISELIGFLSGKPLAAEKPLLLSFDDGYVDFYFYVYPLLEKLKMNAVVFLVTDWMNENSGAESRSRIASELENVKADQGIKSALQGDRRLFLSWGMAQEMAKSGLVEFGSHSMSHKIGFRSSRVKKFIMRPIGSIISSMMERSGRGCRFFRRPPRWPSGGLCPGRKRWSSLSNIVELKCNHPRAPGAGWRMSSGN